MSLTKVSGEITKIVWKSPDEDNITHILQVKKFDDGNYISVIGKVLKCSEGDKIEAEGILGETKYGKQLKASSIHVELPVTLNGIIKYLSVAADGIGQKTAKLIADTFKGETFNVILKNPEKLLKIKGLSDKKVEALVEALNKDKSYRDISIFLMETCDFSVDRMTSIYEKYKEKTIEIIKNNPYSLILDFERIGFKKADEIALKIGFSKKSPERLKFGILFIVNNDTNTGNCAIREKDLQEEFEDLLGVEYQNIVSQEVLNKLYNEKLIIKKVINKEICIYSKELYEAETIIAESLLEIDSIPPSTLAISDEFMKKSLNNSELSIFKDEPNAKYTEEQKEAILSSVKNKLTIITGGPGTGKTTILRGILSMFDAIMAGTGEMISLKLAAPTGKAAQRMTENTGSGATTIHSLIKLIGGEAEFNLSNKLPADVLIIDEASMIDTLLFAKLVAAIKKDTQLILVGDINQLPSIGPGNILKDLIAINRFNVVRLTKPQRTGVDSQITNNAYSINAGVVPTITNDLAGDFFMFYTQDNEETLETIRELISFKLKDFFEKRGGICVNKNKTDKKEFNIMRDVQILSPMNKGDVGNNVINNEVQNILNQSLKTVKFGSTNFKVGDKVIQTKNNKEKKIWNGDIGYVSRVISREDREQDPSLGKNVLEVWFESYSDEKRIILLTHEDLEELRLAYAISIHKSQGSEYPVVIIPVVTSHFNMLERKLFYTGITRAKQMVVLIGQEKALGIATNNNKSEERLTGLKDLFKYSVIDSI